MATIADEYIQEGLEKGLEQGRLEERRTIARQLLKLHDVATVSEITGLSLDEVKALAEITDESPDNGR